MSREIKFRAWSNKFKRMFRVSEVYMTRDGYVHGTVDAGFSNEYFQYLTDEERKSPLNYIGRVDFVKSNDGRTAGLFQDPTDEPFYLIQYTGLKDKNGKEIYEGDILKTPSASGKGDIITTIEWTDFSWKEKLIYSPIHQFYEYFDFSDETGEDSEVIGNIYENPELLEGIA